MIGLARQASTITLILTPFLIVKLHTLRLLYGKFQDMFLTG